MEERCIIGATFMGTLCEKDDYAKRNGLERWFTIDDLWEHLESFNQRLVSPLPIDYFQRLGYIQQRRSDGKVSLTDTGRQHCRDPDTAFTLPENYQPQER
jgi:hypothetical protein